MAGLGPLAEAAPAEATAASPQLFEQVIRPLTQEYCLKCHSTEKQKGDLDLERFTSFDEAKRHPEIWQRVMEMVGDNEMPPEDAPRRPSPAQGAQLLAWSKAMLDAIAMEHAGDPGRVVLRRLTNAQYTHTLRDLTGVDSLDPVREFPLDGAAGEGFTNTGQALVMSPSLVTKYLDAAKGIASHAMLMPDGIRFSPTVTRLDWSNEIQAEIRGFYRKFADVPADKINLGGYKSQIGSLSGPGENGQLPLEKYLAATLDERESLSTGAKTPAGVARERQLSPKYLSTLWNLLTSDEPSPLLDGFRTRWRAARPEGVAGLVAEIARWQKVMWKFGSAGTLANDANPRLWMEPVTPLTDQQELRLPLAAPASGNEIIVYLAAGDAGDGQAGNFLEWQQPRVTRLGRPTILLRDAREFVRELMAKREQIFTSTTRYLAAAAEVSAAKSDVDIAALAQRHGVEADALKVWLDYLGIGASPAATLDLFTNPLTGKTTPWDFIQGWGSLDTPGVMANSTDDQRIRIPGILWPHGVGVHPSATQYAAVGWRSPVKATLRIEAVVTDENPNGGDGATWSLQLRHGRFRQRLATGIAHLADEIREYSPGLAVGPLDNISVEPGDLISLLIGPRGGDNFSDQTGLKLKLTTLGDTPQEWSLEREVSSNILAGNPHADGAGREGVWNFYSEPVAGTEGLPVIPAGSLLARWLAAGSAEDKQHLATAVQLLLTSVPSPATGSADAELRQHLTSLGGPFFADARPKTKMSGENPAPSAATSTAWGLDPAGFGRHPDGSALDPASLGVEAPSIIEVRLPADLFAGGELVTTARIMCPGASAAGTAQASLLASKPNLFTSLEAGQPILTNKGSPAWERLARSGDTFNRIFPAALCFSKIVPSDGDQTIFHREDQPFVDLMLDDAQKAQLDRLWDELHYVNQDALLVADNYESARRESLKPPVEDLEWPRGWTKKYTKVGPPVDYDRILLAVNNRAAELRRQLIDTQPRHLEALLEFADRAYRRPLTDGEKDELQGFYHNLRKLELPHDDAIRLALAGVLLEPAFLYRSEKPGPGGEPLPVSDAELASRLSYFLWSSAPDADLRAAAVGDKLRDPEVLVAQTRRMLGDPRVRHLATEFGCQWLRIHDFDQLSDKSARTFPTFAELRGAMYEETILYFTDLFQRNRPVLNLLDSDYTFLNEALAKHYGIPGVSGAEWRRVDGMEKYARGGILAQASVLAKQSGASRTSPILRGSWIVDVLLGGKLPRPPANVPQLPEDEANEKLSVRQLTEKHTSDPRCASCHVRFDAFGYALENFDAIGRWREKDLGNRPVETRAKLNDGTELSGLIGLRDYLLTRRRADFLRQFCRKLRGYALGRSVQLSDEPLIKEMQAQLAANHYQVDTAIEMIVRSRQFREIRGRDFASAD